LRRATCAIRGKVSDDGLIIVLARNVRCGIDWMSAYEAFITLRKFYNEIRSTGVVRYPK